MPLDKTVTSVFPTEEYNDTLCQAAKFTNLLIETDVFSLGLIEK